MCVHIGQLTDDGFELGEQILLKHMSLLPHCKNSEHCLLKRLIFFPAQDSKVNNPSVLFLSPPPIHRLLSQVT